MSRRPWGRKESGTTERLTLTWPPSRKATLPFLSRLTFLMCLLGSKGFYVLTASLRAQVVKNLPTTQETQVRFLAQEDPLEKG